MRGSSSKAGDFKVNDLAWGLRSVAGGVLWKRRLRWSFRSQLFIGNLHKGEEEEQGCADGGLTLGCWPSKALMGSAGLGPAHYVGLPPAKNGQTFIPLPLLVPRFKIPARMSSQIGWFSATVE